MNNNNRKEVIKVTHLSKTFRLSYKQRKENKTDDKYLKAVDDLSFSLYEGEIYGLLGPNGAGKTTTLRMLATLFTPSSGNIYLDGKDIQNNLEETRRNIGFLTSELKLDNFFTPDYTFDFFAELYGLDKAERVRRKEILFNQFGIDEYRYKKIGELSSGMKQKVSLAISLIHNPQIIIYDEPTNGLDIIASKAVEDYLLKLKDENKSIIISTHILPLVEKLSDRIGVIIDGKMQFEGNKEEVKNLGGLEKLFFDLYDEARDEIDA